MKSLKNEYVDHIKFGRGLIVSEETGKITVEFTGVPGNKIFQFPDAFEQFLKFEDNSLQEESLSILDGKKQLIAEEIERIQSDRKRQEEEKRIEELELKKKYKKTKKVKATIVK